MRTSLLAGIMLLGSSVAALHASSEGNGQANIAPVRLQTEMQREPLDVQTQSPRLSWLLQAESQNLRNLRQSAYEIQLASSVPGLSDPGGDVWDSGKISSGRYVQIEYRGPRLHSLHRYFWRVRVWDRGKRRSGWSTSATFTTGMMDASDWKARWIAAPETQSALPLFRREFRVDKPVARAIVYVSGLGQYELRLNGRNVTDAVLTPGWTDYNRTVLYNAYDVTQYMRPGANVFGVLLGNGMYNVRETKGRYDKFSGSFGKPKMILQAALQYTDGTGQMLVSDRSWSTHAGPIVFSSVYGGEDFDNTKTEPGWDSPGFSAAEWEDVIEVPAPAGRMRGQMSPPIRVLHEYAPVRRSQPRPGILVFDLGQNFSGWPEVTVQGRAGQSIKLIPGELLDANGMVTQRSAGASPDRAVFFKYTLGSEKRETWHPSFTYYGFRYVQVEGAASSDDPGSGRPLLLSLRGEFLHADMAVDGEVASSEPQFGRIHHLIDMAILSNSMSVLTDCPHREKLGWLEQSYLNGASIFFNYDAALLYEKIGHDIADAQTASGMVPGIAPEYVRFVDHGGKDTAFRDSPEWGSASVLSLWVAYRFTGDRRLLANTYPTMVRYVHYLAARSQGHLLSYGLGDWFDIGPRPPGESQLTSKTMTASATYYADLQTIAQIARILGKEKEAASFALRAEQVKAALNARLFHPETDTYDRASQTANAMALVLHLVPAGHESGVLRNLIADIHSHRDHVTAGDIGFHYVVRALTDTGRSDVLDAMLMRNDSPSYGYQLQHGATSLTEAWDANPDDSQNHFMLGHAEEWFYRGLAGISVDMDPSQPQPIRIHPSPVGDVHSASANYRSALGSIRSAWAREGGRLLLEVEIPPGAHAQVLIPATDPSSVTESGSKVATVEGVSHCTSQTGGLLCRLGSGKYSFASAF